MKESVFKHELFGEATPRIQKARQMIVMMQALNKTYFGGQARVTSGITETGEAKFEGSNLVITSRRSFTSPLGETLVEFKEVWKLDGSALTIEKTRVESGESATEKAVFDKL